MPTDLAGRAGVLVAALADRYRLERELGVGGMATVYLAEDIRHHRKVALKVLHSVLSAVIGPERFLKEIELTASLQHPHILPLFDYGDELVAASLAAVGPGEPLAVRSRTSLFRAVYVQGPQPNHDVAADGTRFVLVTGTLAGRLVVGLQLLDAPSATDAGRH